MIRQEKFGNLALQNLIIIATDTQKWVHSKNLPECFPLWLENRSYVFASAKKIRDACKLAALCAHNLIISLSRFTLSYTRYLGFWKLPHLNFSPRYELFTAQSRHISSAVSPRMVLPASGGQCAQDWIFPPQERKDMGNLNVPAWVSASRWEDLFNVPFMSCWVLVFPLQYVLCSAPPEFWCKGIFKNSVW